MADVDDGHKFAYRSLNFDLRDMVLGTKFVL